MWKDIFVNPIPPQRNASRTNDMTPEQQRIAIAEACGWIHVKARGEAIMGHKSNSENGVVPDYLNDLNAMNDAEKTLDCMKQAPTYISLLSDDMGNWYKLLYATAAQRAEAFLKTIGKWEETPARAPETL